ncbi:hypothetical protein HDU98_001842 [Podochytrium sp. JEL0797]|nr:hypothetical protein HDU98_001842 [Podochytrium sp. JEL0797]
MVHTLVVHLYAKDDAECIAKISAKLSEVSKIYIKDQETLSWFVMQDHVDPRSFTIVERYEQESSLQIHVANPTYKAFGRKGKKRRKQFAMSTVSFLAGTAAPAPVPGHFISPSYVGFSTEEPCIGQSPYVASGAPNPTLLNILNALANRTSQQFPFPLRIGGNSADLLWYTGTSGVSPYPNATCEISMATQFLTGAVFPNWSQTQLVAVELGNEPENWVQNGLRPGAPFNISTDYPTEANTLAAGILSNLGTTRSFQIMAPGSNLNQADGRSIIRSYIATAPKANPIAIHYYALSGNHLATSAWSGFSGAWFHGGVHGSPASSFSNINGIPVSSIGTYSPIVVSNSNPSIINVRPEFYGLLGFQRALNWIGTSKISVIRGGGDQLVRDASVGVKYFALTDSSNPARWSGILINKNNTDTTLHFGAPAGGSIDPVVIERIQANGDVTAVTGITIAGQTFDGTTDGHILGSYSVETVSATNASYSVTLPAYSAAILFGGSQSAKSSNSAPLAASFSCFVALILFLC